MLGFLKSSGIYFDTVPKKGSNNAVTSDGIAKAIEQGGGGGGTSDYAALTNKPKINNVELSGNKSLTSLGIASRAELTSIEESITDINADIIELDTNKANVSDIPDISGLATKLELQSTNDRMTQAETDIDTLETALDGKATTASVTALTGRVTQAETDIDTLETALDGKATTASVTALSGRVTQTETNIAQKLTGTTQTWLENGVNPFTTAPEGVSVYSTNPNIRPSMGLPSGLSEYGALIVFKGTTYPTMIYVDVFGRLAVWATNTQQWVIH